MFKEKDKQPLPMRCRTSILFICLLLAGNRIAAGQDPKLSGVSNYALNRPGIVMVRTEYTANVYVNSMRMDNRAFNTLLDSIQKLDHGGGISAEQKLDIALREMNNRPARFFQATLDYIKQPELITSTGTGFFL